MNKYKLVIFDMDGTLADTSLGILNSIRYVQKKMNLPEITLEQMYSHVGPPMEESYNRNFGLIGNELKQAVELHKKYAVNYGYKEITWYDGISELLDKLQKTGYLTAIATLKAQSTVMKILDYFNMRSKFDIIIGTSPQAAMSKNQLVKYCLEKSGVPKKQAVLIGDSTYDAVGAREAEIDFIAVTYGFGFKKDKVETPDSIAVCNNVGEIAKALNLCDE